MKVRTIIKRTVAIILCLIIMLDGQTVSVLAEEIEKNDIEDDLFKSKNEILDTVNDNIEEENYEEDKTEEMMSNSLDINSNIEELLNLQNENLTVNTSFKNDSVNLDLSSKAENSIIDTLIDGGIKTKLIEIHTIWNDGKYFSTSPNTPCRDASNNCYYCKLSNVAPEVTVATGIDGNSCYGFAAYCFYKIFGLSCIDNNTTTRTVVSGLDELSRVAKVGDHIACCSNSTNDDTNQVHYGIYLKCENNLLYLYESNHEICNIINSEEGNNPIEEGWTNYVIRHPNNYEDININEAEEYINEIIKRDPNNVTEINARCKVEPRDDEGKPYYNSQIFKPAPVWSMPCSDKTDDRSKQLFKAEVGSEFSVLRKIKNTAGNNWYEIEYDGSKKGYIFCENVTLLYGSDENPTLKLFAVASGKTKIPLREGYYQERDARYIYAKDTTAIVAVGEVVNDRGNLWYKLSDGTYVYSENVRFIKEVPYNENACQDVSYIVGDDASSVKVCQYSIPKSIPVNNSYLLKGIIDFSYSGLRPYGKALSTNELLYDESYDDNQLTGSSDEMVTVSICDTNKTVIQSKSFLPTDGVANLNSISNDINFESLNPGDYFYCVDAKKNSVSIPIFDVMFTVKGETGQNEYHNSSNFIIRNGVLVGYTGTDDCIDIPEGVTKIGDYCFADNRYISGVNFPSSLREIGNHAFESSSFMGNYIIDEFGLIQYKGLIIPNGITRIGDYAFYGTIYEGGLKIENGVETIGRDAFSFCSITGDLAIPNSVENIGSNAFSWCGIGGDLIIPNSVKTIGEYAFSYTEATGKLIIENGVETIGNDAFISSSFNGDLVIPNSVKTIGEYAFSYTEATGKLIIENGVETIGNDAFCGSSFNGELVIPDSVKTIGSGAFYHCEGFTGNLIIPGSVKKIDWAAFHSCTGFSGLTISEGVETIEYNAFMDCNFIGDLSIPSSVKKLGSGAFSGAGFSGKLTIGNGISDIEQGTFSGSGFTGDLIIPNNIKTIGEWAFQDCTGFTGILSFSNSLTTINDYAFFGCSGFKDIYLPSTVTEIGSHAFLMEGPKSAIILPATFHCVPNSYAYSWVIKQGKTPSTIKIKLNHAETTLESGDTVVLSVVFDSFDRNDHSVVWTSDNEAVAIVSNAGVVTALQQGMAIITATTESGTAKCKVTVKQKVTSFDVDPDSKLIQDGKISLFVGQTGSIELSTNAGWIPWDKVTIANSNTDVVTYTVQESRNQIIINGVAAGNALIGVRIADLPEQSVSVYVQGGTLLFKDQDGTDFDIPIATKSAVYGEKYPELPLPGERIGYMFVGWFTKPEMKGEQIIEDTIFTGNEVLYAGWLDEEEDSFTVLTLQDHIYSGTAIKPQPHIFHRDRLLVLNQDYTLKYNNNTNVSTASKSAQLVITGKGSFAKTETVDFHILPKPLGDGYDFADDFTIAIADKQYNGKEQISKPTIKFGKMTLKENKDYTLSFEGDQVNPGEVTVIVNAKDGGNYTGSARVTYTIYEKGKGLSTAYVPAIVNQTYTGDVINLDDVPVVVKEAKNSKTELVRGIDYDIVYANGTEKVNVGTANILIRGKGDYTGTKAVTFKIVPKKLTEDMISVSDAIYTGTQVKPSVSITNGDVTVDSAQYTVSYSNNTKAASAAAGKSAPKVTVKGKGNFTGTATANFTIEPRGLSATELDITIPNIRDNGKEIKNSAVKPTVKYVNSTTGKTVTLKNGTDYDVVFNRTNTCMQTADINLKGNYQNNGDIKAEFMIFDKVSGLNLNDFNVTAEDDNLIYSGAKITPKITVRTTVDGRDYILVQGKDYTVSYSNNINAADTESASRKPAWKVTGKGAYNGSISGTFTILKRPFTSEDYTVTAADVKYNKKDQKPKVAVIDNNTGKALKSSDYTLRYDSTKGGVAENAIVTVTGKGNYEGTLTGSFRVYETAISSAVFESLAKESYTGKPIKPSGDEVRIFADNKKTIPLTENEDYVLSYGVNTKAGKGTVTVTGIGKYGGSKTLNFTILPKWLQWLL